ncbi:MAG: DsbC family protein [Deltaproteobacteria bacterium]|nr:DsbC family protein [Deltaproteobacteria bacterium]
MRIYFCLLLMLGLFSNPASAFMPTAEGCGTGSCNDCHSLSKAEARDIFKDIQGEVLSVDSAEVPGLWRIEMKMQDQKIPLYLDYSKSYLISGTVIRLKDRKNITEELYRKLNPVDLSRIPTDDALLLGNPQATQKIIVFTDPHCPYCRKLHQVLKQAVAQRPDLLFQLKLLPLKQSSKKVSRTIICNKSLPQLEAAFAGQDIPEATDCKTDAVEQNLALANALGIRATPTLILPDGQIAPGYKPLPALLELIDGAKAVQQEKKQP